MENKETLSKWERLKKYLAEKERYKKELLIALQDEVARLREDYRAWEITFDEYKALRASKESFQRKEVENSDKAYYRFLNELKQ